MVKLNEYPYFDDYDKTKQYTQILTVPGRVAQAREFTQVQSMYKEFLGRLGESVMDEGALVDGCELSTHYQITRNVVKTANLPNLSISIDEVLDHPAIWLNSTITHNDLTYTLEEDYTLYMGKIKWLKQTSISVDSEYSVTYRYNLPNDLEEEITRVQVSDGRIFVGNLVRAFSAQSVDIDGEGSEVIGVKIKQEVITELEDESLLDPAQPHQGKHMPGAHRLKESLELYKVTSENKDDVIAIFELLDGQLLKLIRPPQLHKVIDMMARRLYDQSGNYRVFGLQVTSNKVEDAEMIEVYVAPGRAYVKGYEVTKPTFTTLELDKGSDIRLVTEIKTQGTSVTNISGDDAYLINNYPVKDILVLTGRVLLDDISLSRGTGDIDTLTPPAVAILKVWSSNKESPEYTQGTDYTLTDGDIEWISVNRPVGTYYIQYHYTKTFVKNTDYDLYYLVDNERNYVRWLDGGDEPANGTDFQFNYEYYLVRVDLIAVSMTGELFVFKGTPNVRTRASAPNLSDSNFLNLCEVMILPYSNPEDPDELLSNLEISDISVRRATMEDLFLLTSRVDRSELNQAITDLDKEAAEGQPATELSGIVTDGFLGFTKADLTHLDFSAAIDVMDRSAVLAHDIYVKDLEVDLVGGASENIVDFGRFYTPSHTEEEVMNQPLATGTHKINPYQLFINRPIMTLSPNRDNWIELERVDVDGGIGTATTSARTIRRVLTRGRSSRTVRDTTTFGEPYLDSSRMILDEAITYMRQVEIEVFGTNFSNEPAYGDIKVFFNNQQVSATPYNSDYEGATSGNLKADSNLTVRGTIMVPEDQKTGTVEIRLENSIADPYLRESATANFSSSGRNQIIEDIWVRDQHIHTVTTITTIDPPEPAGGGGGGGGTDPGAWIQNWTPRAFVDPIAQTFNFDSSKVISKVGLYFASKTVHPFTVEIRDVVNGYPGPNVFARKIINVEDALISSTILTEYDIEGFEGGVPSPVLETVVDFDDPVFCEEGKEYCVVVITACDHSRLFIADMGEVNLTDGIQVVRNPYLGGVMFTSGNNSAWTAHQTKDIKFKLYGKKFTEEATLYFEPVTFEDAVSILIPAIVDHIPLGNTITYEYNTDKMNPTDWNPFSPFNMIELGEEVNEVTIRARMTTNVNTAPFIVHFNQLVGLRQNLTGVYLTRNVNFIEDYNTIIQSVDVNKPSGTSVTVKYRTGGSSSEWKTATLKNERYLKAGFYRQTYQDIIPETSDQLQARLELTSNSRVRTPICKNFMNIVKNVVPELITAIFLQLDSSLSGSQGENTELGLLYTVGGFGTITYTVEVNSADLFDISGNKLVVATGKTAIAGEYTITVGATDESYEELFGQEITFTIPATE